MDKLVDYIRVYHNAIPNDLCDDIVKEFDTPVEMEPAKFGENGGELVKELRDCSVTFMSSPELCSDYRRDLDSKLYGHIVGCLYMYINEFHHVTISRDTGNMLVKYLPGQYFHEHTDGSTNSPRTIGCVAYVNNEFTGGEISFFNKTFFPEMKKGSLLMFPSSFQYPHSVSPVTSGVRYSIINWFI